MNFLKQTIVKVMHRQVSKLDRLYQRHSGEECYLFGAGISLKWMDLRQFADRPSILANMAIYHKEVRALNAPYSTIIKPYFFYPLIPQNDRHGKTHLRRNHYYKEFSKSIIENPDKLFFVNLSNCPVVSFSNVIY